MNRHKREIGIDLFRGFAILAVAILHVDEGIQVLPSGWSYITDFALFAVPFFLALSFYLAIDKLSASLQPYPLRSRLVRLLVPYGIWSAIYLFYKIAKYGAAGEFGKLVDLVRDPLALICFGGAGFHLYFLPLLAVGTLLIKFSEWAVFKKISLRQLSLLCLISFLSYEVLLRSGNDYQLGANRAFQPLLGTIFADGKSNPLLRLILVVVAWMIRCAPYVLVGTILTHPSVNKFRKNLVSKLPILWIFVFIVLNILTAQFLPRSVYEITRGYSALLAAISISSILKYNYLIENLGTCSFGIYLIHLLIIEIFQSIAKRVYPDYIFHINSALLLLAAIGAVGISWIITALLIQNKRLSRIIF